MPMSGSNMASTIEGILSGLGMVGENLPDFSSAIGNGSVDSVAGKTFATSDTGSITGVGKGTGVGLTGVISAAISSAIQAQAILEFGQLGDDMPDVADACADALVAELALATLSSDHAPVFVGAGVITPGSIPVVGSAWADAIEAEGAGSGFLGDDWGTLAGIVGDSMALGMATATGNVVIVVVPPPPPTPAPGIGFGSGTIS